MKTPLLAACLMAGCATIPAAPVVSVANDPANAVTVRGSQLVNDASEALRGFDSGGTVSRLHWDLDHGALYLTRRGERIRVDLETLTLALAADGEEPEREERPRSARRRPGRGRQRSSETSPDGVWIARCVDWNVVIEPADTDEAQANGQPEPQKITKDGNRKRRYGTASWVYGEELAQRTAMWWSADSHQLVFYSFDERDVPDFYLLDGLEERRSTIAREGYPKPGEANPVASLMIHNLETDDTRTLLGLTAEDDAYLYHVRFTPDGGSLLVNQTNRHQNELTVLEVELSSGLVRTVLTETQDTWQENRPFMQFLEDGERFIWASERSGYRQFELRSRAGDRLAVLSNGAADVASVVRVDETAGFAWYLQADPASPLDTHLWRVRLDGTERTQLTEGSGRRTVQTSPGGAWFIERRESVTEAPQTTLRRASDNASLQLARPDDETIAALGWPEPELFTCLADDGITTLYGWLYKPKGFDPTRVYPLVIDVYGGPESRGVTNRWRPAHAGCACDVLVAKIDNRGTSGRGKAFMGAVYKQLGGVDLADQVAGVRALAARPYVDPDHVGIYGHSYGGYMAVLAIVKYPEVFSVAVAGSAVTDWRNYDTIYTERYMQTPEENGDGYDDGSCEKYAEQLAGHLLLQHGMMDDNVHPHNAWQLVHALQEAGKDFEMMFYPTRGHGLPQHAASARWDFLYRHLHP